MGSEDTDAKELFERAERALYERKRNGKNGITFSEIV
jgi:PleD family two-component response regulator